MAISTFNTDQFKIIDTLPETIKALDKNQNLLTSISSQQTSAIKSLTNIMHIHSEDIKQLYEHTDFLLEWASQTQKELRHLYALLAVLGLAVVCLGISCVAIRFL